MAGITYDKERVKLNLCRVKKGGHNFEIVVDPDAALEYRQGKSADHKPALKDIHVFHDASQGARAGEAEMKAVFGEEDHEKVAEIILKEGELQLTSEIRDRMREEKRKSIISRIHMYGIDPRTKAPHPPARVEAALDEAKIKIDEYKSAEEQVPEIVKQLQQILPIKIELKKLELRIPASHAAKCVSIVKRFATKVNREEWTNDGTYVAMIELPAGKEADLYDNLNSVTHGDMDVKPLD